MQGFVVSWWINYSFSLWTNVQKSTLYTLYTYIPNREQVLWPAYHRSNLSYWAEVYSISFGGFGNQNRIVWQQRQQRWLQQITYTAHTTTWYSHQIKSTFKWAKISERAIENYVQETARDDQNSVSFRNLVHNFFFHPPCSSYETNKQNINEWAGSMGSMNSVSTGLFSILFLLSIEDTDKNWMKSRYKTKEIGQHFHL